MTLIAQHSSSSTGRFVAGYYVLTIALGAFVLLFHGRLAFAADLVAVAFYLAMTAFFYDLSKHASRSQADTAELKKEY
jgi:hypothetical protein